MRTFCLQLPFVSQQSDVPLFLSSFFLPFLPLSVCACGWERASCPVFFLGGGIRLFSTNLPLLIGSVAY